MNSYRELAASRDDVRVFISDAHQAAWDARNAALEHDPNDQMGALAAAVDAALSVPPKAADTDYDQLLTEQGRAGLAATRGKTDREQLEDLLAHMKLLKSFADATGPIIMHPQNKRIGKAKAISQECEAAIDALTEHLANPPSGG